jgi:pyruvate,orthophosphate dikinase
VVIQAMVFGNLGEGSGTGVLFTRDPLSGVPEPYGEWLPGGQGEDVVSGTHNPLALAELARSLPAAHAQLLQAAALLEREHADVQDIEFTIERERLYLLQTRAAKRSPPAAVRIAADLVAEGTIEPDTALRRVTPEQVQSVLCPTLSDAAVAAAVTLVRGVAACPGVASGHVLRDTDAAERATGPVVLARRSTSPEDVAAMIAARAVVTERGGSTSHAAVVTRALGRPSVVGVGDGATADWEGREVTVDGNAGVVYDGVLATQETRAADVAGLAALIDLARERASVALAAAHPQVVDLDDAGLRLEPDRPADPEALVAAMRGAAAVRGSVLGSAEGARAAVLAGVPAFGALPGQREEVLLLRLAQARLES